MAIPPLLSEGPHGGQLSIKLHDMSLGNAPMVGIWLPHPSLLRVPMVGRDQCGYVTPSFLGPEWWVNINMATSPLPS